MSLTAPSKLSREVDPGNASLLFNTSVVYVVLVILRVSVFMDGIIKVLRAPRLPAVNIRRGVSMM